MNAIDFLIKEHNNVRQILADITDNSHREATKKEKFAAMREKLLQHEAMEHEIWYPHFKNDKRLDDTVKHLLTEENKAKQAFEKFDMVKSQAEWEVKFAKLKKDIEHHAAEEEDKLFPQVEKLLSKKELEEIGKKMYEFKKKHTH